VLLNLCTAAAAATATSIVLVTSWMHPAYSLMSTWVADGRSWQKFICQQERLPHHTSKRLAVVCAANKANNQ
jgi:hypothetical protein